MFSRLPVASLTLRELIGGNSSYFVPPFQRPYAWGVEQAIQMLDDITSAAGLDAPELAEPDYFLGTVLLLAPAPTALPGSPARDAQSSQYQIVDGQQRLTTLTILFAALRDCEDDAELAAEVAALVLQPQTSAEQVTSMPGAVASARLTLSGRDRAFFNRNVQCPGCCDSDFAGDEPQSEAARRIVAVRDAFSSALEAYDTPARRRLARYLMDNCHVVVTLSHEIERAHRLFTVINERGKPLQRNDILKVEVLGSVDGEGSDLVRMWEEAEQLVGGEFEALFGHLRTIYGRSEPRIVSAMRGLVAAVGGSEAFLSGVLLPYAHINAGIAAARRSPDVAGAPYATHLLYLGRLNGTEWMPAVMLTLGMYQQAPRTAQALIAAIDRTSHLLRVACHGSGRRIRKFQAIVRAIASGQATTGEEDVFAFTRDELRAAAYNLRDLHRRNQQFSKLLLLRINDVIERRVRNVDPADLSVEHVLPVRPPASSSWRDLIPDPEMRDLATECLGNLTLLPSRLNEKVRNRDFAHKRDMIASSLSSETKLAITEDVVTAKSWDIETIAAREQVMLDAAAEVLRIDLSETALAANGRRGGRARRI